MKTRTKMIAGAALAVGVAGGAAGIASAAGGDDAEAPITGDAFDKASAAALDHTGEGTVSDTEVGDEDSYFEVEVTLDDGSQVDVQLDEGFNVVDTMADDESPDDSDTP
ncbi:MAG: hypothetical protein OSA99_21540 [Acidimicrobiales bacterium]|nr:hypothetical protein [Acidimicrobiales bacterium]